MPVVRDAYPILEHDTEPLGIIRPNRHGRATLPARCVLTFFGEVLAAYIEGKQAEIRHQYESEMRDFPIYCLEDDMGGFCVAQAPVGSASIAMMADYLIGHGVRTIIACGACGVLEEIPVGDVLIPVAALRDEGASYHYLPPAREIALDAGIIRVVADTLAENGIPYRECKTWTTDAFYRETPDMVAYRREEGCQIVEMECATLAAVARFRGATFGQLLYSGDILTDPARYDERKWSENISARALLFRLSLEALGRWAKALQA